MKTHMKLLVSAMLIATVALTGCKSELDNKPAAKVEDVKKDDGAAAKADDGAAKADDGAAAKADDGAAKGDAPAGAATLKIDPAKSKISFVGAKVTGDHTGEFKDFEGSVTMEGDKLTGMTYTVKMASVESDAEKLTGHLKSGDFFDVENHPTSTFTSTEIKEGGEGGATHTITGKMNLRGTEKMVTFPATIQVTPEMATGTTEFKINRKDFNIVYPGKPDDLIKDEVLLKINLTAPRG